MPPHPQQQRHTKTDEIAEALKFEFGEWGVVFGGRLYEFMQRKEPDLGPDAFRARIGALIRRGALMKVAQDMYVVATKPKFSPTLELNLKRISKEIRVHLPSLNFCVWSVGTPINTRGGDQEIPRL